MKSTMFLAAVLLGLLCCLHGVDSFLCGARKMRHVPTCLRYKKVLEQVHRDVTMQQCGDLCADLKKCVSFVYGRRRRTCVILNGKCPVTQKSEYRVAHYISAVHGLTYHEFERCSCAKSNPCGINADCVQKKKSSLSYPWIECKCKVGFAKSSKTDCLPCAAPKKQFDGGCTSKVRQGGVQIERLESKTFDQCVELCRANEQCRDIMYGKVGGKKSKRCYLLKAGCTNNNYGWYKANYATYSIKACHAKTCTGKFYEEGSKAGNGKARPPAGTVCTSKCFQQKGRWGASYCHVSGGSNWGAPCDEC